MKIKDPLFFRNKSFMNKSFFRSTIIFLTLLSGSYVSAQSMIEYASMFSSRSLGGTARFQGFAGAGTALGADLSMGSINPAGLGAFRNSELGGSLGIGFAGSRSSYFGENNRDNRGYMYFPNFGIAFCGAKDDIEPGAFRGGTFAITYNRINDFQNQVFYSGINKKNYINQYFTNLLQISGYHPEDLDPINPATELYSLEALIYHSLLVEPDYDYAPHFYNPVDSILYNDAFLYYVLPEEAYQEQLITTRGAQNQFDLAYGANFSDKYYLGASVGIVSLRHHLERDFYEKLDQSQSVQETTLSEMIKTTGTGFNFKVGFIARPVEALRLGLTLQTPTAYYLKQNYSYTIKAIFNPDYRLPLSGFDPDVLEYSTVPLDYSFRLTTPAILRGGMAVFLGKRGFVSADLEYLPYQMLKLSDKNNRTYYSQDNRYIMNNYKGAFNYRLGAEIRNDIFRYRAGFALFSNPLNNLDKDHTSSKVFTLGFGLKWPTFYLDMAISHSRSGDINSPYPNPAGPNPIADISHRNTSFIMSIGSHF